MNERNNLRALHPYIVFEGSSMWHYLIGRNLKWDMVFFTFDGKVIYAYLIKNLKSKFYQDFKILVKILDTSYLTKNSVWKLYIVFWLSQFWGIGEKVGYPVSDKQSTLKIFTFNFDYRDFEVRKWNPRFAFWNMNQDNFWMILRSWQRNGIRGIPSSIPN